MVAHLVLLTPRSDLTPEQREAFIRAFEGAARAIPSVRRVRVGKRILHGQAYEARAGGTYAFAAMFEFDDLAGLQAYLGHPAHQELGARFYDSLEEAVACDYDLGEVEAVRGWFEPRL